MFIYFRYKYNYAKVFTLRISRSTAGNYFILNFCILTAQYIFYLTFVYHGKIYILCQISNTSKAGHF